MSDSTSDVTTEVTDVVTETITHTTYSAPHARVSNVHGSWALMAADGIGGEFMSVNPTRAKSIIAVLTKYLEGSHDE